MDSNEDNNNANNTSHKNKKSRGNDRENGAEDQESNDANEAGIQNWSFYYSISYCLIIYKKGPKVQKCAFVTILSIIECNI